MQFCSICKQPGHLQFSCKQAVNRPKVVASRSEIECPDRVPDQLKTSVSLFIESPSAAVNIAVSTASEFPDARSAPTSSAGSALSSATVSADARGPSIKDLISSRGRSTNKQPAQPWVWKTSNPVGDNSAVKRRRTLPEFAQTVRAKFQSTESVSLPWSQPPVNRIEPPSGPPAELSFEQRATVELALCGRSLFFTGPAGTGKSLVLRELIRRLKAAGRSTELAVTASTGIAAVGLGAGGQTLHSWAGIGIGNDFNADTLAKRLSRKAKDRWIRTEILVIDEISMLDAQLFELLEHVGRLVRNRPDAPFGGIQLILCGDFFQLPPVGQSVRFCFEAHCWSRCVDLIVVLKRVFRQAGDQTFVNILGEARCGRLSQQSIALLKSRLNAKFDPKDDIEPTILFPYKKDVDTTNATRLLQLDASTHSVYLSDDTREGAQPADATAKAYLARLCAAPERLELRIGAQVILLKNMNQVPLLKSRATVSLMNGERGTVVDFIQPQDSIRKLPVVKFSGGVTVVIDYVSFSVEVEGKEVASRSALPLGLAWAISIHKSQGMTIRKLDLAISNVFEHGQAYVALSRCTSLAALTLRSFDAATVRAHPKVLARFAALEQPQSGWLFIQNANISVSTVKQQLLDCTELNSAEVNAVVIQSIDKVSTNAPVSTAPASPALLSSPSARTSNLSSNMSANFSSQSSAAFSSPILSVQRTQYASPIGTSPLVSTGSSSAPAASFKPTFTAAKFSGVARPNPFGAPVASAPAPTAASVPVCTPESGSVVYWDEEWDEELELGAMEACIEQFESKSEEDAEIIADQLEAWYDFDAYD